MSYRDEILAEGQGDLSVPYRRRYRLCQMLTVVGILFLLPFGIYNITGEDSVLGASLISCAAVGFVNLIVLKLSGDLDRAATVLSCILIALVITLIITGGLSNTGLLWVYPIIAIGILINRFKRGVVLCIAFTLIISLLLFTPFDSFLTTKYSFTESSRFMVSVAALGIICLVGLYFEDRAYKVITQLHQEDLRQIAYYDNLTGLPNRWSFKTNLDKIVSWAARENKAIGLLYIDLDNFKQINDQHGHEFGDEVLRQFSEKLWESIRSHERLVKSQRETLARLAGDEFVVVLPDIDSRTDATAVANRVLQMFKGGFNIGGVHHNLCASIGVAVYPGDTKEPTDLLRHADIAMYYAKRSGRNCYKLFNTEIANDQLEQQTIEKGLQAALNNNEFSLVYMPIYDCEDENIVSIEVLLRCLNPSLKGYGPDTYIPIAETTGIIKEIDIWVIQNALDALVYLQKEHAYKGKIAINISGVELSDTRFPEKVSALLNRYAVSPELVELEVTETAFVAGDEACLAILDKLSKLGVSIALDDFGTGYTAFSQLIHYPADCLKIDRSFVAEIFSDNRAQSQMTEIINNLGKLYQLRVIAEGVETEEQLDYLRKIGCDWAQGFYFSRPLVWSDLLKLSLSA